MTSSDFTRPQAEKTRLDELEDQERRDRCRQVFGRDCGLTADPPHPDCVTGSCVGFKLCSSVVTLMNTTSYDGDAKSSVLVCAIWRDELTLIPGSRRDECSTCHREVAVAPTSPSDVQILCCDCAVIYVAMLELKSEGRLM